MIDHGLLLRKLEMYGVRDGELTWFRNYLNDRRQRVIVGGARSSWHAVGRGVPQGSVLGALLFSIFVNDMPNVVDSSEVNLYADDTTLYYSSKNLSDLKDSAESDAENVSKWIDDNGLIMNSSKTQCMFLSRKGRQCEVAEVRIVHRGEELTSGSSVKYLGVVVDKDLKWKEQVSHVCKKCLATLSKLRRIFPALPVSRILLDNALVLPHLDFCSSVWHHCGETLTRRIEKIHNYAMRLITSSPPRTSSDELREKLSWMTLRDRRFHILCKVHRCLHRHASEYLCKKFTINPGRTRFGNVYLQRPRTEFYRSFEYGGGMMWNNLPCLEQL